MKPRKVNWLRFAKTIEAMDITQLGHLLAFVMQQIIERGKELRK